MPSENYHALPLNEITAVYRLDDGRPYFSIEIAHLDEDTMHASTFILQLYDPKESELWLSSIRGAAMKARLKQPLAFSQRLVEFVARALEQERDYDPNQFHMFKVVQRATKSGSRSSSDDLTKLSSNICILAIGIFKVHLIPLPKASRTASSTSLSDMVGASHGVVTLTSLHVQTYDDAFSLTFRVPCRQQTTLCLASYCVTDIALWLRQAADYLRPEWQEPSFTWNVPANLDEELLPVPPSFEDHQAFDRTLTAYCAAYEINPGNIRYAVNYECEDAPAFELNPPADSKRSKYTAFELLAIFRSLRFNESFGCLSFKNVSLDALLSLKDPHGHDHVPWTTRLGTPLSMPEQANYALLVQEIQGLALKSRRLRRLDFSYTLSRKPSIYDEIPEPGCGICEALLPLCIKQLTNVDWIVLNGISLAEADIDYIYAAAVERSCHFRALDLGSCGLDDQRMHTLIQALSHQGSTMESFDLSSNPARLNTWVLDENLRAFEFLRKLNFSNITKITGPEPLLSAELLLQWRLEEFDLHNTPLNPSSVEALARYLKNPQSDTMRILNLDQCQLSGYEAADLLTSMGTKHGKLREMSLSLTKNRLEEGHEALANALARNFSPTQLIMQMLEYHSENSFQLLLDALQSNSTIKFLDISKMMLPADANEETCEKLYRLFAQNGTLEMLDISGEQAHLEAAILGNGLNHALTGLKQNHTLLYLHVENQNLGLQGANTLASVLESNNTLREVHCDGNEINLQAFTVLVNSLEHNTTILYLPLMDMDRAWFQKRVDREVNNVRESNVSGMAAVSSTTKATVKRTLGKALIGQKPVPPRVSSRILPESDIQVAMGSLTDNWAREVDRLRTFLLRNYKLAQGITLEEASLVEGERPVTGDTLGIGMEDLSLEKTPIAEVDRQLVEDIDDKSNEADALDEVEDSEDEEILGALEMERRFDLAVKNV